MSEETLEHILDTAEDLLCSQRALILRMKDADRVAHTRTESSSDSEYSEAMDIEQEAERAGLGCAVEPISKARLDEIKQNASANTPTWTSLRELYPHRKSGFAPLSFSASTWAAVHRTGRPDDNHVDEAFSQAATMAAYGVETLGKALGDPVVDRRLVSKASKLLGVLCAALVHTRDSRRDVVFGVVEDGTGASQRGPDTEDSEHMGVRQYREQGGTGDSSKRPAGPVTRQRGRRAGGTAGTTGRSNPYSRNSPRLGAIGHQQRGRHAEANNLAITGRIGSPETTALTTNVIGVAETEHTSSSANASPTLSQRWPLGLERQDIIRAGLLRQGRSESAISAHINRFGIGTNRAYNSVWRYWAAWCGKRGLDPAKRSDADLEKLTLECNKSASWKGKLRAATRSVWAVTEHVSPPDH